MSNKLNVAKGRYNNSKRQEKRLQKIIEICFLNKDLNEEWIRVSDFLKRNLTFFLEIESVHYKFG